MRYFLFLLFPLFALSQGATNDYIFYQKPASGPLVVRPVTPTVGRLMGWPTSISAPASIILGTGLSLSGSTLNATASSAWADITGKPANVTAFGNLSNAAGVLTNNGSGSLSYTGTTTGGLSASDDDKLPVFYNSGTLRANQLLVVSPGNVNPAISIGPTSLAFSNTGGIFSLTLTAPTLSANRAVVFGDTAGTVITTGDTGTVTNTMLAGSIALSKLATTGTPDNTTFLRGDGAWTAISSGATLAANTYTGLQQFSGTTHAGIRLNNLTTAERDALSSPAAGMAIWNTTDARLQLHNGSAWTSGMVRLSGDTMTGALALSVAGAASVPALWMTGALNVAGTGTTTFPHIFHQPTGATAATTWSSGANAGTVIGANEATGFVGNFFDGRVAGSAAVRVDYLGSYIIGSLNAIGARLDTSQVTFGHNGGTSTWNAPCAAGPSGFSVRQTGGYAFCSDSFATATVDLILLRAAANTLQLGANTATASATATGQTLKGPNATGTTSTGGSLTIAGGTGTSAGGAVIISTAATTTQTERARFSSAGVTIGASGTAIASVISATATLDFPSTNEHECSSANITVTGAAVGDVVALGIPTEAIGTSGVFFGYVSAADTVTIRYNNTDKNNAVDPASGTFRATVIKH